IFSDINKELKQSFATGNKYGFYTLLRNSFFTSAAQAKNFSVEFLGKIQVFASNTYMVNTNCFKHFKFLLKVILVVLSSNFTNNVIDNRILLNFTNLKFFN